MSCFKVFGFMKTRWLILAVVLLPTFGLSGGFSVRNPAIRNPIGIGTAPVSSYSNGLVTIPIPIDATSDLSITGNVRDGKYFRGNVPYRSVSDLGFYPGSSSINSHRVTPSLSSFIRDTAGSEDFGRHSRIGYAARPYYSPDESVAITVPGRAEVLSPRSAESQFDIRQNGNSVMNRFFTMESLPNQRVTTRQETTADVADFQRLPAHYGRLNESLSTSKGTFIRGISSGFQDIERVTPGEVQITDLQNDKIALERLRKQSRRPLIDPRHASRLEDRAGLTGDDPYRSDFDKSPSNGVSTKDGAVDRFQLSNMKSFKPSVKPAVEQDAVKSQTESEREYHEVLGRIKQQLDELSRSVESRLKSGPDDTNKVGRFKVPDSTYITKPEISRPDPKSGDLNNLGLIDSNYRLKAYEPSFGSEKLKTAVSGGVSDQVLSERQSRPGYPDVSGMRTAREIRALPEDLGELSRAEMSREASRIIGAHENRNAFVVQKFSRYLQDAEDYIRAGKYYKAADSYNLALIYDPDNTQALAGRSHALFAAGEYISSALFLTRALAVNPEYAKVRVDFATLLCGADKLTARVADIERWFSRSGSGRLQLLLGYVYYQTGRLSEAKRAIDQAGKKMPQSPAVAAISTAIDYALLRR